MGTLSRAEMAQVIQGGGSVLYLGRTLTSLAQLPSEAELAEGDPEQSAAVVSALDAQIQALQAQRDKLAMAGQSPTIGPVASPPAAQPHPLVEVFGQQIADRLTAAGYDTPEKVQAASDEDLLAIEGIGEGTVKKVRATYKD